MSEYPIRLEVWGDYAAFNVPGISEGMTYPFMTPGAARGILEAIYWKPEFHYIVRRIHVINPIRTMSVKWNGVDKIASPRVGGINCTDSRTQKSSLILKDVRYGIEADIDVYHKGRGQGEVRKHVEIFQRRARKGQYFKNPYFGVREHGVSFQLVEGEFTAVCEENKGVKYFGPMYQDLVFTPAVAESKRVCYDGMGNEVTAEPRMFVANMVDGVVEVPELIYPFNKELK